MFEGYWKSSGWPKFSLIDLAAYPPKNTEGVNIHLSPALTAPDGGREWETHQESIKDGH
jgi:hypothetical protein